MFEATQAYNNAYTNSGQSRWQVAIDYFDTVIITARSALDHYFIVHGKQGFDFNADDDIVFKVGRRAVARASLLRRAEGPYIDSEKKRHGKRVLFLRDVMVLK